MISNSIPSLPLRKGREVGRRRGVPCLGICRIPAVAMEAVRCAAAMEESKAYVHYNHTDACSAARWTARESYEFMYGRPWHKVAEFYSEMVRGGGHSMLSALFSTEKHDVVENFKGHEDGESASVSTNGMTGRWARVTFKIILSYDGRFFDGWQKQPGLNTVQGLVENSLGKFVDEKKAQQLKEKSLPVEGYVVVAGRTDKGVTALQQACSYYTWRKDVTLGGIEDAINKAAPGNLRVVNISKVSRVFHPNFSAKWRRYLYIFPLSDGVEGQFEKNAFITADNINHKEDRAGCFIENDGLLTNEYETEDNNMLHSARKPRNFTVGKVSQLLHQLEGKCLSYKMFSRDTKASRSIGPPTECFMFHARSTEARLPCADEASNRERVMCVELVANRFLRKMVRVLVATAIREAAAGADEYALLKLMDATCRRATAPPAPPDGLCLIDVGYGEFKRESCLIL